MDANDEIVQKLLFVLLRQETECGGDPDALAKLEAEYERLAAVLENKTEFLMQRNCFRIRHAARMRIRRPRVLYGERHAAIPNFHREPLMQEADVVFLSIFEKASDAIDHLFANCMQYDMTDIVRMLPEGFKPDLYFICQDTSSALIRGMEAAPFPTVLGLCHHFKSLKLEAAAGQFDFVLPLSHVFCDLLSKTVDPQKIIELPFGLAWASFHQILFSPVTDAGRDIDVVLTFGSEVDAVYGPYRRYVSQLFDEAQAKFGDRFRFVRTTGVSREEYFKILKRSKIVLNAVGIHGPYNYRTMEAICAGALLMQYDGAYATGPQYIERYFTPDTDFVLFDKTNFLKKLEWLLTNPDARLRIAACGQQRMVTQYSYNTLYRALFERIAREDRAAIAARRPNPAQAALGRIHYHLQNSTAENVLNPWRALALQELEAASQVLPSLRTAFLMLMPLFRITQAIYSPESLAPLLAGVPKTETAHQQRLAFYDYLLNLMPNSSIVDVFNHIMLYCEELQFPAAAIRRLFDRLQAGSVTLTANEIWRIYSAASADEPRANYALYRIFNIEQMLAGDDWSRRQQAACDYMKARLAILLEASDPADGKWHQTVDGILAKYPIHAPVDTEKATADVRAK